EARIAQNPNDYNSYPPLAGAYLQLGQPAKAIAALRKAIELNPQFKTEGEQYIKDIQAGKK
ncbi:tetratricopeptide repeat protein, partial [Candidatus Parcubacteria bacterium]|nr:tetratricopeptide repeat protein [Candidatus Parcubacteria bacterium]